ncbi:hypothetical protein ABZ490_30765 [Streptomyces sp. NPDC005811]|uniref:hypothetical protein n=1 Tax=Streptomyces sp. NPDC005811 TaxID=3154565 RepID=UPI0033DCED76
MFARGTAAGAAAVCAMGVLSLTGCSFEVGGEDPPGPTAAASTPSVSPRVSPVTPSPSASATASRTPTPTAPVPVNGPDQKLVTMTITGGFAGVHREVVLRGDGTVRVTDEGASRVRRTTAAQFRTLRLLLGDPALDDVPSFTMSGGTYDAFQYTLRFGGRTVMTDRSGEEPALDRLIDALDDWLPRT